MSLLFHLCTRLTLVLHHQNLVPLDLYVGVIAGLAMSKS